MPYDLGGWMTTAVIHNLAILELQEIDTVTHTPHASVTILSLDVPRQECDTSTQCRQSADADRHTLEKREDILRLHFFANSVILREDGGYVILGDQANSDK